MTAIIEIKVWHMPQLGGASFEVLVDSFGEAQRICKILADYDLFQFDNHIKPDYTSMNGTSYRHPIITKGEWWKLGMQRTSRPTLNV